MSQQSNTIPTPAAQAFTCTLASGAGILGLQVLNNSDASVDVFAGQQLTAGTPTFSVPAFTYLASLISNAEYVTLRFNSANPGSVYFVWLDTPVVSLASGIPTAPPSALEFSCSASTSGNAGTVTLGGEVYQYRQLPPGIVVPKPSFAIGISSLDVSGLPEYAKVFVGFSTISGPPTLASLLALWHLITGNGHIAPATPLTFGRRFQNQPVGQTIFPFLLVANLDDVAQVSLDANGVGALAADLSGVIQ